ncbi:MAG TPA: ABC transporter permease subunit [Anaerolineales bacterium]|nr:ABC transporter permease subunit [Anaerolineales bacterium]
MTTDSVVEKAATAPQALLPAPGSGPLGGFRNIFAKELADWFGTRRWWIQTLVWLVIFNAGLAMILFVAPVLDPQASGTPDELYMSGLGVFFNTLALLGSIGVIILTQDEIIQEKQSGTAAWILTKPVSRASFILSKLLSNVIGVLIFVIAVPALVAYIEILIASGRGAPVQAYLQALGVILLTLTFYISLSLMLGTFFEQRGPILAGTFGVLVGGLVVSQFLPKLTYILPLSMDKIALSILQGQPLSLPMMYELITAGFLSVLFTVAALWRFGDEEF